jgi:putative hydrolase of the HAD superfamily
MIKVIIFDSSNTLAYKKYRKGNVKSLWKKTGKKCSLRKFLKTYEKNFQLDNSGNFELKYKKMLDELKIPYTEKLIKKYALYRKRIESTFCIYTYAMPLLKELKQKGYKTSVLSNKTFSHANQILKSKLTKYIDRFFFSYDLKSIKPDPRNFKAVLSYFKVKPSEALMIGDTYKDDVLAARKLGIKAILFKNGKQLKKDMKKTGVL